MDILNFTRPVTGNFIVDIIVWLVSISSSIAVGIILFTLLLKIITLPFDYVSRSSMRKNSLKMEEMRPELEKLQQQYANDKALYNQKMMALYKKNGYSMFGACLPTILTLVIFIVALNGFTSYSQFQNRQYFYNMTQSYNNVIYSGIDLDSADTAYITRDAEGNLIIKAEDLYALYEGGQTTVDLGQGKTATLSIKDNIATNPIKENDIIIGTKYTRGLEIVTTNSFVKTTVIYDFNDYTEKQDNIDWTTNYEFSIIEGKIVEDNPLASAENNFLKVYIKDSQGKEILSGYNQTTKDYFDGELQKTIDELKKQKQELIDSGKDKEANAIVIPTFKAFDAEMFIKDIRQQKSADRYHEEKASFLWVKNIWVTDSPLSHPVVDKWDAFKSTHAYNGNDIGENGYNNLTAKLGAEKTAPNGYFILVILTAGTSLLMQLVMSKSQKAQMELQTVDGQGKQTQKIMTIMMPIMMAFFAFMYTSAFSIYIILSSLISVLTTFGINKIVDVKFKKEKAKKQTDDRIRGRVYTPKEQPKEEKVKKEKKSKKDKNAQSESDFLSGKADGKKHIRGRLK